MTFGIYCIEHIESGRKYIGKSKNIEARFQKHKSDLSKTKPNNGVNSYLWNLVNKYGLGSLKFWIVEEVSPQDDDVLADREVFWMDELKTLDRSFGFNLRRDSSSRTTLTPEMIENIRKAKLGDKNPNFGKPMPDHVKENLSILNSGERNAQFGKRGELSPNFGVKRSDETRKRVSDSKKGDKNPNFGKFGVDNPLYGRKLSPERIKKMSESRKGKKISEDQRLKQKETLHRFSYEQYDLYGKFVSVFRHQQDLKDHGFLPPNVTTAASAKSIHKGYYWVKIPKIQKGSEDEYTQTNKGKTIQVDTSRSHKYSDYLKLSIDGRFLARYSTSELRRDGFDFSAVLKCCKGLLKSYKGFKWRKIPKIAIDNPPQPEV